MCKQKKEKKKKTTTTRPGYQIGRSDALYVARRPVLELRGTNLERRRPVVLYEEMSYPRTRVPDPDAPQDDLARLPERQLQSVDLLARSNVQPSEQVRDEGEQHTGGGEDRGGGP